MALKSGRYGVTKKQLEYLKSVINRRGGGNLGSASRKVRSNKRDA